MGFLDQESASEQVGRVVVRAGIGLVVALFIGGGIGGVRWLNSPARIEAGIEAELQGNPALGGLYVTMKTEYPEEYRRLVTELAQKAGSAGQAEAAIAGRQYMREFITRHRGEVQKAPEAELLRARDLQVDVVEMLALESTELCAQFSMAGLPAGAKPSTKTQRKLLSAGEALIRAAAAGRDHPVARTAPTEVDGSRFVGFLSSAGLSTQEIDMLLQGDPALQALPIERQCEIGQAVYHGLERLPPDSAARLTAAVLVPGA